MIEEHNNVHVAITSKIDTVSGHLHPTIAQMHEYSGQIWGSDIAKDDFMNGKEV